MSQRVYEKGNLVRLINGSDDLAVAGYNAEKNLVEVVWYTAEKGVSAAVVPAEIVEFVDATGGEEIIEEATVSEPKEVTV